MLPHITKMLSHSQHSFVPQLHHIEHVVSRATRAEEVERMEEVLWLSVVLAPSDPHLLGSQATSPQLSCGSHIPAGIAGGCLCAIWQVPTISPQAVWLSGRWGKSRKLVCVKTPATEQVIANQFPDSTKGSVWLGEPFGPDRWFLFVLFRCTTSCLTGCQDRTGPSDLAAGAIHSGLR